MKYGVFYRKQEEFSKAVGTTDHTICKQYCSKARGLPLLNWIWGPEESLIDNV